MEWITAIAQLATAGSLIVAIRMWRLESRKVEEAKRRERFDSLNTIYLQFLTTYVGNSDLQAVPYAPKVAGMSPDERRSFAVMEIVLCMIETAAFLRRPTDERYEGGWAGFAERWAGFPEFQRAVEAGLVDDYDRSFQQDIRDMIRRAQRT